MASLLNSATFISRKADGTPNALGRVYTYAAGTLTPQATYTTQAGGTPQTNPVILDADGTAQIWLTPTVAYRIVEKTAADVLIRDTDNILASELADLASTASGKGDALIGVKSTLTGGSDRTQHDKNAESVSLLDFGAVGNGTADDTAAVGSAIASGQDVFVEQGKTFAITGNVGGFVNGQRIYGGGCFKKKGSTVQPMFALPDEIDGLWFDGIEFDGTSALFSAGNAVPAILGYITKSLKVTHCYFHDVIDVGIKLRDGANLYAAGNRFFNVGENGIELHNYPVDVRTGINYTGTRPLIEGNHKIIGNHFEKITRYENPAGPLVDACGVAFYGAAGYPQKNIVIQGNVFIDCLRFVFTENNDAGSIADGVVISGNTFMGGVNGGTAQNIYCKVGVGLIAVQHAVVTGNTFRNVANTNPVGTETAGIIVSGSAGVAVGNDIEISHNICVDDSGLADRTEWGIYCLVGDNIRVHHNYIAGCATGTVYLDPTYVTNATCYANDNATAGRSWVQPVPLVFVRENIPAAGNQSTYPWGVVTDTEAVLPVPGRIVGVAVKLSTAITAGNLTVKVLSNGIEDTDLQLVTADFGGQTVGTRALTPFQATQTAAGQRITVILTTDAPFAPTTMDATITLYVDLAMKL